MKTSSKKEFGVASDGRMAYVYTLENENGMKASVTDFGAALVELWVPTTSGETVDVVLGYEDTKGYEVGGASFGAPVGRCANRIGGAAFEIDGVSYTLTKNDNGNNLHSGNDYYNKRFWVLEKESDQSLTFILHSPDGDQGYPGALDMRVIYELTEENTLRMKYHAVPNQDTIINMTNHSYFNLNGHQCGNILGHQIQVDADYFTRADEESIPTGELVDVTGTPMDLRMVKSIGDGIDSEYEATRFGQGYDHNWVLKNNGKFAKVAEVVGDKTGILMEVWTDLPGVQVYAGNFLNEEPGKMGAIYQRRQAVCFETQYFPDAIHHNQFVGPICKANETYETVTEYHFVTE